MVRERSRIRIPKVAPVHDSKAKIHSYSYQTRTTPFLGTVLEYKYDLLGEMYVRKKKDYFSLISFFFYVWEIFSIFWGIFWSFYRKDIFRKY